MLYLSTCKSTILQVPYIKGSIYIIISSILLGADDIAKNADNYLL